MSHLIMHLTSSQFIISKSGMHLRQDNLQGCPSFGQLKSVTFLQGCPSFGQQKSIFLQGRLSLGILLPVELPQPALLLLPTAVGLTLSIFYIQNLLFFTLIEVQVLKNVTITFSCLQITRQ
ncbi:hypothetical protein BsWGS_02353 [Bradybaena similaris]